MSDLMSARAKRILTNVVVIFGPLIIGLSFVTDKLPAWAAIMVGVLAFAIKQWQSELDLKAEAKRT